MTTMGTPAGRDAVKRLNRNTSSLTPGIRAAEKASVIVRQNRQWAIGRTKHLEALPPHQKAVGSLLPNRKESRLNWQQNYGTLRYAMSKGEPIADVSLVRRNGRFLYAERFTLLERGWRLDRKRKLWIPPK